MSDAKFCALGMLVIAALSAVVVAMVDTPQQKCAQQWVDSGFATRYRDGWGCEVEFAPGRWVLASKVVINVESKQ